MVSIQGHTNQGLSLTAYPGVLVYARHQPAPRRLCRLRQPHYRICALIRGLSNRMLAVLSSFVHVKTLRNQRKLIDHNFFNPWPNPCPCCHKKWSPTWPISCAALYHVEIIPICAHTAEIAFCAAFGKVGPNDYRRFCPAKF